MEISDSNLNALQTYVRNTLNADSAVRQEAEKFLISIESNQGYPVLLLVLLQKQEIDLTVRTAGSVIFKNFVKRNWKDTGDGVCVVHDADREIVKREIVQLMLSSPDKVQRQISEAISLIGKVDFPAKWQQLLPTLVEQLSSKDPNVVNSVLQTANSLFKRYRYEMRSDELWLEIKYSLEKFAAPLTELFKRDTQTVTVEAGSTDPNILAARLKSLSLMSKVFFSLNTQDLPEFFEDNMGIWMPGFLALLKLECPALKKESEEEGGVMEELRGQICDNIAMYAQKYEEEFEPHLPPFVEVVWGLLVSSSTHAKYDIVVSNAMQFLAIVAEREKYKALFQSEALSQICEKVVVPNMEFRATDMETFEDNPEEFIRKDIEGSDVDTRRRSAADLIKALCKYFEPQVIQIFSGYIQHLFAEYAADPGKNWAKKDVAVYLVTCLAAKGSTARHGATKTSELVNLIDFFKTQIAPDLSSPNVNELPVLKADALKYVVTFRGQLPKEVLVQALVPITHHLSSNSVVVHSYAAHALERLFTIRNPENCSVPLIQCADVEALAADLLTNLFGVFSKKGSEENEYAMKAIMRSLILLQTSCAKYTEIILAKITEKLMEVAKNPSKPYFNHYLFESLCILIKQVCGGTNVGVFEEALFPPFQHILQADVLEFMPYIFQILAMMLDMRSPGAGVPPPYLALFPFLLVPAVWERQGSIPGLVRLMRAYIKAGFREIVDGGYLNPLLGVFQKLVASKVNDHEGFKIINALLEYGSYVELKAVLKGVFVVLFNRLQASKTVKLTKNLIVFMCMFMVKFGPDVLIEHVDEIQPTLFSMVVEKIVLVDLQKISGTLEKKICSVGLTKLLTESPHLYPNGKYCNNWVPLMEGIIGMFELPEEDTGEDEDQLLELEDVGGYSAAYSQLAFAQKDDSDPTGVSDPKAFLVKAIHSLNSARPGQVRPLLEKLQPKAAEYIKTYMNAANLMI